MSSYLHPPFTAVRRAVEAALTEDLEPFGDLSATLVPADVAGRAEFVNREPGVLAGTACATETFRQVDPAVVVTWHVDEGDVVHEHTRLATVTGPFTSILVAERTALNFLGHLSGIATLVHRYNEACTGPARVWDTRKTTPGLRALEKAAVRAGGGVNHRGNLSDWIMIKDNHLLGVGITEGVRRARERWPGRTVHVECDRIEQVEEALSAGADALLLDNMAVEMLAACVSLVDQFAAAGGQRPLVEASGGVRLETVGAISETGVDLISSSELTNSARVLDIGLDLAADQPGGS